jgi:hypothetical protein
MLSSRGACRPASLALASSSARPSICFFGVGLQLRQSSTLSSGEALPHSRVSGRGTALKDDASYSSLVLLPLVPQDGSACRMRAASAIDVEGVLLERIGLAGSSARS